MKKDHLEVLKPQVAGEQAVLATIAELPEFSQGPVTFSCAICKKLRFVKDDFDLGDVDVRCSDYGRSCEQPSDPTPENHEIFVGLIDEISEEDQKIADVIHATISVSNSDAWKKYPEKAKKACEKERKKYETSQAYDIKAEDWKEISKTVPDATYVVLAMVWTWAYIECGDDESELKCRICGMGHVQKDSSGKITTGIDLDETLWCVPPSTWQTRVFEVCQALLGNSLESDDFKAAFLQAMLRGPPTYARLPEQFETEDGLEIKRRGGIPVHHVRKAIYGLKRAGQDWTFHASQKFTARGWQSLRSLCDGSPSQFVRVTERITGNRVATEGEIADAGKSKSSGNGRNAGSGNGCNPIKVTVKTWPSDAQNVKVVVEVYKGAADDEVLANQAHNLSVQVKCDQAMLVPSVPSLPPLNPDMISDAAPQVQADLERLASVPEEKCTKVIWAKKENRWRPCKHNRGDNSEGLCTLHYNLKYGKAGEAEESEFEDAASA